MDDGGSGAASILFVILLLINFVVSGYGAAIWAAKPDEEESSEKRSRRARRIREVIRDQADYVDAMQLISTGCSLVLGAVCAVRLQRFLLRLLERNVTTTAGQHSLVLVVLSVILTGLCLLYLILTFAIDIPKRLGVHHPDKWIDRWSGLIYVLIVILRPFCFLVSRSAEGILYLFGVRGTTLRGDVTEGEIRSMVVEGHEQGVIQQTEAEMIANIFEFSDKEAQDIMTHRNEMITIESSTALCDAVTFMLAQHNSRFPVYRENIDEIIGIMHLRDAVKYKETYPDEQNKPLCELRGVLMQPLFVPETKNIDALFQQMQREKTQMVIVIDEYGQTAGLVAMEDILEEIVGNILDEYDVDEKHIFPTNNPGEFLLDGRTPLEDISRRFGIDFGDTEFETLNGFMISRMQHIPEANEHFVTEYGGYRFRVLSTADRQVQRVLLTRLEGTQDQTARTELRTSP